MTLQEKIFYCRKKEGLSQEALAEKIGVSRQAISKWETGEATPEVGKLALLAKTFNVTADWLLSEDEPEEKEGGTYNYGNDSYKEENYGQNSRRRNRSLIATIMRLIAKYSWVAGIYIAIVGLIVVGIGSGFRFAGNAMVNSFVETTDKVNDDFYGNSFGYEEYEENVEIDEEFKSMFGDIEDSFDEETVPAIDMGIDEDFFSPTLSVMTTIINGFSGAMIIIGAIMLIGGIVLAIYLRKNWDKMTDKLKQYM